MLAQLDRWDKPITAAAREAYRAHLLKSDPEAHAAIASTASVIECDVETAALIIVDCLRGAWRVERTRDATDYDCAVTAAAVVRVRAQLAAEAARTGDLEAARLVAALEQEIYTTRLAAARALVADSERRLEEVSREYLAARERAYTEGAEIDEQIRALQTRRAMLGAEVANLENRRRDIAERLRLAREYEAEMCAAVAAWLPRIATSQVGRAVSARLQQQEVGAQ
jgi:hypothetical protein